ncbi:MAG: hypothetical protein V3V08_06145 [Nannocystaceae bacterium]
MRSTLIGPTGHHVALQLVTASSLCVTMLSGCNGEILTEVDPPALAVFGQTRAPTLRASENCSIEVSQGSLVITDAGVLRGDTDFSLRRTLDRIASDAGGGSSAAELL